MAPTRGLSMRDPPGWVGVRHMQRCVSAGRAPDGGHRPNRAVAPATSSVAAAVVSHRRRCSPNAAPRPCTGRTQVVRQAPLPKRPLSYRVSWAPRESRHLLTLYAGTVWSTEGPGGIPRPSCVIRPANRACRGCPLWGSRKQRPMATVPHARRLAATRLDYSPCAPPTVSQLGASSRGAVDA